MVDDDADFGCALRDFLRESGLSAEFEPDGARCLARVETGAYDLMILGAGLPGVDGIEVLVQIRLRFFLPVIMLTPRAARTERIRSLDCGADDCLEKPLDMEELLARVRAVLRRSGGHRSAETEPLRAGELSMFPGSRSAFYHGKRLDLTAMECDILEQLLRSAGRAVSRDRLSVRLYDREASPYDRTIDTHVSRIRRKLGEGRDMIVSVRGTGYQLCAPALAGR